MNIYLYYIVFRLTEKETDCFEKPVKYGGENSFKKSIEKWRFVDSADKRGVSLREQTADKCAFFGGKHSENPTSISRIYNF